MRANAAAMVEMLRAAGEPTRLRLLALLAREELAVAELVQLLDAMLVTPRIVGRSVGLAPLEVLITMMASASLFGFLGVLLAVPLGAVVKILLQRAVRAYLRTDFYQRAS